MKKLFTRSIIGIFLLTLLIPGVSALDSGVIVKATDTVAGYGTLLRVMNAPPLANVEVLVEQPDGSKVLVDGETDKYGKTKIDLEGFHTKQAGTYSVMSRTALEGEDFGAEESFHVYADTVSPSRSVIEMTNKTAAANGNDYVQLKVFLKDKYNNPIGGHTVDLMSSRLTDETMRVSNMPYTNDQGSIAYNVYSREAGVSTIIVHDTTSGVTLNNRAEIAFYEPQVRLAEMGGYRVMLAQSGDAGPVSYLEIEDLADTVDVGSTLNFTVTAYDDNGYVANDYTGLVRFSSSDSNATLPNDYQFEAEDQGSHTFSLGLSFKTEGTQTLSVTDIDDTDIRGETEVEVGTSGTGESDTGNNDDNVGDGELVVNSPLGGTYSNDNLTFSGEGAYGDTIEIYDNDELLADTTVDVSGEFTYIATKVSDGNHTFVLKELDPEGTVLYTSSEINITIDTSAPALDHITAEPEETPSGDTFTVTVYTESGLEQVAVVFNNGIFEMTEDLLVNGIYEVVLTAPSTTGEYDIDVILVDDLGNEISYDSAISITIVEAEDDELNLEEIPKEEVVEEEVVEEEVVEEEPEEPLVFYPGQVTAVEGVNGDGRVTLSWQTPTTVALEDGREFEIGDIVLESVLRGTEAPAETEEETEEEQAPEEETEVQSDYSSPVLMEFVSNSLTEIELVFDEEVMLPEENAVDTVDIVDVDDNDLEVTNVELKEADSTTVVVTTAEQTPETDYFVSVKDVTDLAGNEAIGIGWFTSTAEEADDIFAKEEDDTTPPSVEDITLADMTTVEITFTEEAYLLGDIDAVDAFTIIDEDNNEIGVESVDYKDGDKTIIVLTTEEHSEDMTYTLSITDIGDINSNELITEETYGTTPEEDMAEEETSEEETMEESEPAEEEVDTEITISEITIDHYRIYYGPDPELMFSTANTWDSSTTWYVPELQNGTTYFFKVVAIDVNGNESVNSSETLEGTPESEEEVLLLAAEEEQQQAEEVQQAEEEVLETTVEEEDTPDTGPEVAWLLLLSLGFAELYFRGRRRRENTTIVPIRDIQ